MRLRLAAATLLAAPVVLAGCTTSESGSDQMLPEVTVQEFSGDGTVDVSTLRGPMVINLWASYCSPCRQEMPILQAFHEAHGDEVAVVGIDYQDPQRRAAEALVRRTGVTYRLLADPLGDLSAAGPLPNLMGLPFLALVDEDGALAYMEYGEVTSLDELEDLVDEHLGTDL